jgi:hypothetical protein
MGERRYSCIILNDDSKWVRVVSPLHDRASSPQTKQPQVLAILGGPHSWSAHHAEEKCLRCPACSLAAKERNNENRIKDGRKGNRRQREANLIFSGKAPILKQYVGHGAQAMGHRP